MKFVVGKDLDAAIRTWAQSSNARCAVAFWGNGARTLFPAGASARIICNLLAGGTNPHEIEALCSAGHDVRQHDRLHAKVYLCDRSALVASANLSANGLGLEAEEQAHWIEAGALTENVNPVAAWFEQLWNNPETRRITAEDIGGAIVRWRARRFVKPTLRSFAAFDPMAEDFPLLYPFGVGTLYVNDEKAEAEIGATGDQAYEIIANSLDVDDKEKDVPFMQEGRWVLWWRVTQRAMPHARARLGWGQIGTRVNGIFRYDDGPWHDAFLTDIHAQPVPFDCEETHFRQSFLATLGHDDFQPLRTSEPYQPYFAPNIELMRTFWAKLKNAYTKGYRGQE